MLNDRLFELLQTLDADELDLVWSYLGNDGKDDEFGLRSKEQKIEPLSREIRRMAAHTIADLVRRRGDHEYAWESVLRQIADKLEMEEPRDGGVRALEDALLERLSANTNRLRNGDGTLRDARRAAEEALDELKSTSRWRSYRGLRFLGSIGTLRPIWGPNYQKLVPAVFFILSAARTHEALKEATK